jgi:glutamate:GABA antiporter
MTTKPALKRELGLRDLTLFAVTCIISARTCIISARWIPIAAHAGPGSVTLWFLAAVLFMVPLTVAVAALVAKYPEAGGLYLWTRRDFGPWAGFLSFWVYWMGIAFLFPTAALLYIKVGFSMFGPLFARLGDNRFYLVVGTVAVIWIALART